MPQLSKVVTTAVAGALLATAPAFPALASAHAAPHTTSAHGHAHPAKHAAKDKLAGPRRGAANAIAAQLKSVNRLMTKAAGLSLADSTGLGTALTAAQAAVAADGAAVSTAASVKALRTLVAAAVNSRQIAGMQFEIVVAADAAGVQAGTTSATVTDLVAKLSDPTIVDPAVLDPANGLLAMNDATAKLTTATDGVASAVSTILAVAPTATRAESHAARAAAQATLSAVSAALLAAAADITQVQTAYSL